MKWFDTDRKDLIRLLGGHGEAVVGDSIISAWQPDISYKPEMYFLVRDLDESSIREMVNDTGIELFATPAVEEAVWKLPEGLKISEWFPEKVPAGEGLQGSGSIHKTVTWIRWYQGRAYLVIQVT